MRVVTGSAKGRKLCAPPGLKTRPTPAIVKESVFSAIQFEVEGAAVLDLFAGSGQMGIEALSRGARSCVFIENAKDVLKVTEKNVESTGFGEKSRLVPGDAWSYVQSAKGPFDIAFLDPPYKSTGLNKILPLLGGIMSESGIIICETDSANTLPEKAGPLLKHREYRYGKTKITIYRNNDL
ncbi:MAG: 16S rRNA (guanine(966)-N(2))-methyltransferase RsmD [Oscillospiraceae bacterium]|nr:16S rRNA (guanine(966)-N(2))-methyltransferase RsmD [Oscillospiraceae bacterium]